MLRWKVRGYLLGGVCCVLVRGQASGDEERCAGEGERASNGTCLARSARERRLELRDLVSEFDPGESTSSNAVANSDCSQLGAPGY